MDLPPAGRRKDLLEVFINLALIVSGVILQSLLSIKAAAPLTTGAAMLVPLSL